MGTETFELNGEYIELNQLLKLAGACGSGGEGKLLVASGLVHVDGAQELRKTFKVRAGMSVTFEDLTIQVVQGEQEPDSDHIEGFETRT